MFAAAALVFANYSARLEDGDLRNAFREAADTVGNQAVEELRAASEKAD
jgi:hypothetical protein